MLKAKFKCFRGAPILILSLLSASAYAQDSWTDHSRLLPDKLRGIPEAISIIHSPTPVYPEQNRDTISYHGKYIWKHQTQVSSPSNDLTVVDAGSFIWLGDRGWGANIKLTNAEFSERFNCPGGVLRKGKSYTFIPNWRYGDIIYAGDALWFVIAKDANGKLYKGIAVVETEGILKQNQ